MYIHIVYLALFFNILKGIWQLVMNEHYCEELST